LASEGRWRPTTWYSVRRPEKKKKRNPISFTFKCFFAYIEIRKLKSPHPAIFVGSGSWLPSSGNSFIEDRVRIVIAQSSQSLSLLSDHTSVGFLWQVYLCPVHPAIHRQKSLCGGVIVYPTISCTPTNRPNSGTPKNEIVLLTHLEAISTRPAKVLRNRKTHFCRVAMSMWVSIQKFGEVDFKRTALRLWRRVLPWCAKTLKQSRKTCIILEILSLSLFTQGLANTQDGRYIRGLPRRTFDMVWSTSVHNSPSNQPRLQPRSARQFLPRQRRG
jgi:hypothetical protein